MSATLKSTTIAVMKGKIPLADEDGRPEFLFSIIYIL